MTFCEVVAARARCPDGVSTLATPTRTEAYTDAVFAIAATLLVLDLTTATFGEIQTDAELWGALFALWPKFLAFGVSFALLSDLWIIHTRQFQDMRAVDTPLLWLNSARLLFIVLIPFTTSLTSEYSSLIAGRVLLPIDFFFAALLGHLSWRWSAARSGHLLTPEAYERRHVAAAAGLSAVICAGIAVILSPWIGSWAFLAFVLSSPLGKLLARRTPPTHPGRLVG